MKVRREAGTRPKEEPFLMRPTATPTVLKKGLKKIGRIALPVLFMQKDVEPGLKERG